MFYELFAAAVAFCLASGAYDQYETIKGIKAGVAIEGFDLLVGDKPKAWALVARDTALLALVSAPALVAHFGHNVPVSYGGLTGPVVYGIKHIMGARAWVALEKPAVKKNLVQGGTGGGGNPNPPPPPPK